jgi:amino acid permease
VDTLLWLPFAGLMLVCALALMVSHVRSWRAQQAAGLDPKELDYRRRQFRRRMQTSAMLAVVAAALPVGMWILRHDREAGPIWPKVAVIYWGGVLVLVLWLGALALADMWATKRYYGKLGYDYRVEQARLEAELRRIQAARGNGKPSKSFPGIGDAKGKGPNGPTGMSN